MADKSYLKTTVVIFLLFLLTAASATVHAKIIYVDADADGANNGSSWIDAFNYLQDALTAAQTGDEIRVAQGIYRPVHPYGSREVSFVIDKEIVIKGGYAGPGHSNPDERDIQTYVTVLSGDINANDDIVSDPKDLADEPTRSDNSYHVITAHDRDASRWAVLDGFVITGGNANGQASVYARGGGIDANQSLIIRNCIIERNNGDSFGGACSGVKEMENCIVRYNYALHGGGLWDVGRARSCVIEGNVASTGGAFITPRYGGTYPSYTEFDGCIIRNNRAKNGGVTYISTDRKVIFRDCEFTGNEASKRGGAIYIYVDCTCSSRLWLYRCLLRGNSAGVSGGGFLQKGNTFVELYSCEITGNWAGIKGGGICCELFGAMMDGSCDIYNSTITQNATDLLGGGINCMADYPSQFHAGNTILWGNQDESGPGTETAQIHFMGTGTPAGYPSVETSPGIVNYCCIQGLTGDLGGEGNIDTDPCFVKMGYWDANGILFDGDYHLLPGSPCIDTGDPDYKPDPDETDLDGKPRVMYGRIDIGAYEFLRAPRIIYVDADANGANDGSSWEDAYNFLQDALAAAYDGDEIRVAQGIYKPDQGVGQTPGDRTATFHLINGVTLKGGYAGFGEPDPNARDIDKYKTILSGDLYGNDVEVTDPWHLRSEPTRAENSYHVVTDSGTEATPVLDGFTITGGNANGTWSDRTERGGGMHIINGDPMLINCSFWRNSASVRGGGMFNDNNGNPMLTNCIFYGNLAEYGGGMGNWDGTIPTLTDCTFKANLAGDAGGGLCIDQHCSATLTRCTFIENSAERDGGGMFANEECFITLTNCVFTGNSAYRGGGLHNDESSTIATLTSCKFSGNHAQRGGGIYNEGGCSPTMTNCIFSGNAAEEAGGAMYNDHGIQKLTNCVLWGDMPDEIYGTGRGPVITYSDIQGSWPGEGNIDADPCFVEAGYWDSNEVWVDGDYHLLPDSPCIDAGDPNYIAGPNETDLDGRPRIIGGRIDMGAYEYDSTTILALVDIDPDTLNLNSKGKWITAFIWLPDEYDVTDIEPNSVLLQGQINPHRFWLTEDRQIAIAKFNREEVQNILSIGDVELTISGQLTDGTAFEATDTINVIDKEGKR
jgi:hypothetical protein